MCAHVRREAWRGRYVRVFTLTLLLLAAQLRSLSVCTLKLRFQLVNLKRHPRMSAHILSRMRQRAYQSLELLNHVGDPLLLLALPQLLGIDFPRRLLQAFFGESLCLGFALDFAKQLHLLRDCHTVSGAACTAESTHRLDELAILHELFLVLDVCAGDPLLDLVAQSLQLLDFLLQLNLVLFLLVGIRRSMELFQQILHGRQFVRSRQQPRLSHPFRDQPLRSHGRRSSSGRSPRKSQCPRRLS